MTDVDLALKEVRPQLYPDLPQVLTRRIPYRIADKHMNPSIYSTGGDVRHKR